MMIHLWSVLCSRSITDTGTNNLSLIDIIEQYAYKLEKDIEIIPINGVLVTLWMRDDIEKPEVSKGRVTVIEPQGTLLIEQLYDIDLTEFIRLRVNTKFGGLPYRGNGMYNFSVQIFDEIAENWNTVSNIPIQVTKEIVTSD